MGNLPPRPLPMAPISRARAQRMASLGVAVGPSPSAASNIVARPSTLCFGALALTPVQSDSISLTPLPPFVGPGLSPFAEALGPPLGQNVSGHLSYQSPSPLLHRGDGLSPRQVSLPPPLRWWLDGHCGWAQTGRNTWRPRNKPSVEEGALATYSRYRQSVECVLRSGCGGVAAQRLPPSSRRPAFQTCPPPRQRERAEMYPPRGTPPPSSLGHALRCCLQLDASPSSLPRPARHRAATGAPTIAARSLAAPPHHRERSSLPGPCALGHPRRYACG